MPKDKKFYKTTEEGGCEFGGVPGKVKEKNISPEYSEHFH
jgi:hypothetical protein